MKRIKIFIFIAATAFIYSCNKSMVAPPPIVGKPIVITPVVPPVVDTTPDYHLSFSTSQLTVLDSTHTKLTEIEFYLYGEYSLKYDTTGTTSIRLKNVKQANVTYQSLTGYDESLYLSNVVQKTEKVGITVKDTSTKVCYIITDHPAAKDSVGKPIITVVFLYNSLNPGAGSIGIQSNIKFKTNEISADAITALSNKKNYFHL